jgi:hypothetical protein
LVVPDGEDHPRWDEVVGFVDALGVRLDEWQWLVLRTSLRRRADLWAAFAIGVCAPRQNGKNGILEVRELVGACVLRERFLIHTAHLADTSNEAFHRMEDIVEANDWLSSQVKHVRRTNGRESIVFKGGSTIRFRTRTRGGGRGFSGSPIVFDEAMFLPEVSMGSILPVASAQPDPQLWYMGSAVDQTLMEDGVAFARVRERALAGDDDRLAYFEWSLDADAPDLVEDAVAADPGSWAACNPAFGIRITEQYVKAEKRELDPRTFAVERLGVGDWPLTDGDATVIPLAVWDALADEESRPVDPVCFAFDVKPDRSASSIGVAGLRDDGLAHVEVVDHDRGTDWVVGRLVALVANHRSSGVFCDTTGPAASLLADLERAGVTVEAVTASAHARACGQFYDKVSQEQVRHLGTPELRAALRGARTRPLGEAWAWARAKSTIDISPLVAVTLALAGVGASAPSVYAGRELVTL